MSLLDYALFKHITYIVYSEHRPFSIKDCLEFTVNNETYTMTDGTFRNKICQLKKEGKVEVVYYSSIAFYTLKGVHFTKSIPSNHMGVSYNNPFYHYIQDLVLGKNSIHNLHLKFESKNIWSLFSSNPDFKLNSISKDIMLGKWKINDEVYAVVTIHRTNTVSIVIGCSYQPFPLDIPGIIDLSNVLTRIEERISKMIHDSLDEIIFKNMMERPEIIVPSYKDWIVTMWHFGADSLVEYGEVRFSIKWKTAENIMIQVYSKVFKNNKCRIRLERHEYPNKRFFVAIEEKLNNNNG